MTESLGLPPGMLVPSGDALLNALGLGSGSQCEFGACGGGISGFQNGYTYNPKQSPWASPTLWQSLGELLAGIDWSDPNGRLFGTHYCGPGGGGDTTGALDQACQAHDICYDQHGLTAGDNWNPVNALNGKGSALRACNQALCDAAARIPGGAANTVRMYFEESGMYGCHP